MKSTDKVANKLKKNVTFNARNSIKRTPGCGRPLHRAYTSKKHDSKRVKQFLKSYEAALIDHLGGHENISNAEIMVIHSILGLKRVLYYFDQYIAKEGVFNAKGEPLPVINCYTSFSNSLSRQLQSIGLSKKDEKGLNLQTYLEAKAAADE